MLNRRRLIIEWLNERWRLLRFTRGIITKRRATLNEADATTASSSEDIIVQRKSPMLSRDSSVMSGAETLHNDTDAPVITASAKVTGAKRVMATTKRLGLIGYFIGEGRSFKTILTNSVSDLATFVGKLVTSKRASQTRSNVDLHASALSKVQTDNKITGITSANALPSAAASVSVTINDSTQTKAHFVYWFYPTPENGNLAVAQSYNAIQTNNTLEVI